MTTPKIGTVKRSGYRMYVDPDTDEKVPSVTSISGALPKAFLQYWAQKVVAEAAVEHLGEVVGIAMKNPQAAVDFLKGAPRRSTAGASERGTKVHEILELLVAGEEPRVHPEFRGYVKGFKEFVEQFEPEWLYSEETVWSKDYGYAGSFDAIATVKVPGSDERERVLIDFKTTKSGVHADVALQLNGYARADHILRPADDGGFERIDMPEVDGAAVLHLRPEAWSLVPVALSEEIFDVFISLLDGPVRWERHIKKSALGRPIAGGDTGEDAIHQ